jgi:hypothetical protein
VAIRDKEQNVVQAKCCIMLESTGKARGTTVEIPQSSPKPCWNHLQKHISWVEVIFTQITLNFATKIPFL